MQKSVLHVTLSHCEKINNATCWLTLQTQGEVLSLIMALLVSVLLNNAINFQDCKALVIVE
jgi:hypothetical protein